MPRTLSATAAAALVFVTSGAVLVLEILAGRLLAPYVGVTLETYTAVIGTVLAGLAAGAWLGGAVADRVDPRLLLGPLVAAGGGLALAAVPVVRALGDTSTEHVQAGSVLLAGAGFFLPSVALAAVTPTVVKLQLHDLGRVGGVVGRLSGAGTAGALVGTFLAGFVLVAEAPTRSVVYGLGGFLVLLGVGLWLRLARGPARPASRAASGPLGVVLVCSVLAGVAGVAADDPCDVESAYACLRVTESETSPSGRVLWLNRDRHAYVDLDDPTHLEFEYVRAFAAVVDAAWPGRDALDAVHVGGGGFTMPRYLAATRPGTVNTVLELDPAVVEIARRSLGLRTSPTFRVRTGDARIGIRGVPAGSADLVVGDAFGDLSVPWHLTTREFVAQIDEVLAPDGVYVMNVIDAGPLRFLRAELATLRDRFGWVGVLGFEPSLRYGYLDNFVLVAAHREPDRAALADQAGRIGYVVRDGRSLDRLVGDAPVLTDDFAPVDQWYARAN